MWLATARKLLCKGMISKGIIAALAFSLASFFGCSKPATTATVAKSAPAAESKVMDLGVLQMTNHYETLVSFGPNRDCRIIPKMLSGHDVQLTLTLESKTPDGRTAGLSIVQIVGKTEEPFQISIGDTNFTFTPQIAEAN